MSLCHNCQNHTTASSLHVDRTYRTCVIISQNLTTGVTNLSQALLGLLIHIDIFDKFPIAFNKYEKKNHESFFMSKYANTTGKDFSQDVLELDVH